jgi:ABC-type lipoprotein release transport system permease subunit
VSPTDPLTFVLVCLILSVMALIAILVPARAGMRLEPAATLRAE